MDDLEDIVHDVKLKEKEARGEDTAKAVVGTASILETFHVTNKKNKEKETVFGSRVLTGELTTRLKYQVLRDGELVYDSLSLQSLKHHKKTVSQLEKGQECGVCFDLGKKHDVEFQRGDIIECYKEVKTDDPKFCFKAGVAKSY